MGALLLLGDFDDAIFGENDFNEWPELVDDTRYGVLK